MAKSLRSWVLLGNDPLQAPAPSSRACQDPQREDARPEPDLTSPTRAAVLTKRAAAGVRASGEQACWKGRGQEAGSMGRDPGENGRLNILLCKSEVWIINWCPNMKAFGGGSGPWQFRSCPSFFVATSFSAAPEQALLPVAVPTQSSPHCSSGGSPPMRGGGTAQPRAGQTRLPPRDGGAWSHGSLADIGLFGAWCRRKQAKGQFLQCSGLI